MLETLYNLAILGETGILAYGFGKLGLDYAWEKTVQFITNNDLWNTPEVAALLKISDHV